MATPRTQTPAYQAAKPGETLLRGPVPPGAWRSVALLAVLAFVTYAYFHQREGGWNENSRFALTYAICFDRTFTIDAYHEGVVPTKDKAVFGGHFYTEKAPGSSVWAVPACALHAGLGRLLGIPWTVSLSRYVTRVLALSLPAAAFLLLFWRVAFALTGDLSASLWAAAAYGLGTQALPYATIYTGHLLSGLFSFSAFALGFALRSGWSRRRVLLAALAGLALGWAVLTEYQAVLIAVPVAVYVLVNLRGRGEVAAFLLSGLVPMAFLAWYNTVCFGSPFHLSYRYTYYPLFREYMAQGVESVTYPHATVLYGITISKYRGLFFVSPVLALGLYGWWVMWRTRRWRSEALVVAAAVVAYFAFVSCIHVDQWDGGSAFGPRFLIPVVPFLALPVVFAYRRQKPLFFTLVAVSIAAQFMATATEPQPHESIMDPLFEVILPRFLVSEFMSVANWGTVAGLGEPISLLPLYAFAATASLVIVRWSLAVEREGAPAG
jgi:hypothetical protein